jgi:IPP transferase
MKIKTIGIAGGGQLGRMLTDAAHQLGFQVIVLDPTPNSPAGQVADEQIVGDYKDAKMMRLLAKKSDVLTFEVESVNSKELEKIASKGKGVHPVPQTLSIIKDKLHQKQHLKEYGIPMAGFMALNLFKKTLGDTYNSRCHLESMWIGIMPNREELRQKIHMRLDARIKHGMVAEVKRLHTNGLSWKRMEELGLEYRYLALYLQKKISKDEMLTQLETKIWQYAKRQMTYWRRNKEIQWFPSAEEAASACKSSLRAM